MIVVEIAVMIVSSAINRVIGQESVLMMIMVVEIDTVIDHLDEGMSCLYQCVIDDCSCICFHGVFHFILVDSQSFVFQATMHSTVHPYHTLCKYNSLTARSRSPPRRDFRRDDRGGDRRDDRREHRGDDRRDDRNNDRGARGSYNSDVDGR